MKFLKSLLVIATIIATTQATTWDEIPQLSQRISQNFQSIYIDNYLPKLDSYQWLFDYLPTALTTMYEPDQLSAAQKAGIDYVVNQKNCYSNLYNYMSNNFNNCKNWIVGNFTQYNATFQDLVNKYVDATKAGMATIQGRAGCGPNDPDFFKSDVMMIAFQLLGSGNNRPQDSLQFTGNMINGKLLEWAWSFYSTFLNEADPVGYMKALEATTINPNFDLLNDQIYNVAYIMVNLINGAMNVQVDDINTGIANVPAMAQAYQCTGQ